MWLTTQMLQATGAVPDQTQKTQSMTERDSSTSAITCYLQGRCEQEGRSETEPKLPQIQGTQSFQVAVYPLCVFPITHLASAFLLNVTVLGPALWQSR